MFEVLVYLYENYWRPDACPEPRPADAQAVARWASRPTKSRKRWSGWTAWPTNAQAYAADQSADSLRVYSTAEREPGRRLDRLHQLSGIGRRAAARHARDGDRPRHAVGDGPLDLEDLKVIVLMVFWSLGEEPDALILDELFVAPEERLIH
jgi:Smg protein